MERKPVRRPVNRRRVSLIAIFIALVIAAGGALLFELTSPASLRAAKQKCASPRIVGLECTETNVSGDITVTRRYIATTNDMGMIEFIPDGIRVDVTSPEPTIGQLCNAAATYSAENRPDADPAAIKANFYCGRAAAALKSGDSTVCTEQLSRLPDAVGDQGTNPIITGGNVALACGDEDWLKLLVEDGTADNPLFPRFGTGYDGTLLNE